MLAWVVIDRTYSRQFLPKSSSLRTLCICVEFSDSLRPTSVVPTTYALTLATAAPQPFCNQSVTHSFYLDGGYTPLCAAPTTAILSNAYPMFPISFIFQSRAHSFALFCAPQKLNAFIFKRFRTLRQKNSTTGRGEGDNSLAENTAKVSVATSLLHYILASSPERKQHRLGGRTIRNGLEFRVLPPERLRHLHFRSLQDADELQGIDDGLALKVIVGDHERLAGALCDFADARDPGSQLFGRVEIVVTLMSGDRCIVGEPRVVAPAVKPHIPDGRSGLSRWRKRSPDDGLVDVAESGAAGLQQFHRLRRIPRTVANFDDQRIVREPFQYRRKVRNGFRSAMKRKRELQQDRAEPPRRAKHIEARANGAFICRSGTGCRGSDVVREPLPELGAEDKARIRRHEVDPLGRVVRTQRLVKRSVDLDGVKEFREIGRLMESFGTARWIDVAGPIGIRPARGAHTQDTGRRGIAKRIGLV